MRYLALCALAIVATPLRGQTGKAAPNVLNKVPTGWQDTTGWKLVVDHIVQPAEGVTGELGRPASIALLQDGRLFVVDHAPVSIKLFDAKGKFLRTYGRDGAGPGEYQSPTIATNGQSLLIQDQQQKRMTLVGMDGKVIRTFAGICCAGGYDPFITSKGNLVAVGFGAFRGETSTFWITFDSLGRVVDTVAFPRAMEPMQWKVSTKGGTSTYSIPFAPRTVSLMLPDRSMIFGRTDRFDLIVSGNGIDTLRRFGRMGVTPAVIPTALRDSTFKAIVSGPGPLREFASKDAVPKVFDLWSRIDRDGEGNFWVTRTNADGQPGLLDVFSSSGSLLGTVPRPWPIGARTSWIGSMVAVLDTDKEGLPRVMVYRIEKRKAGS